MVEIGELLRLEKEEQDERRLAEKANQGVERAKARPRRGL